MSTLPLHLLLVVLSHEPELVDAGVPETTPNRTTVVRAQKPIRSAAEMNIERDVLQAAPRAGAVDVLRLVPGLVATQHSGEGKAQQLFLRGFDAVHGQDVELQVAGMPVNAVSHLHAQGYADLNWLIPETVQRIKVTEGTYRAFQGDFATAGTVRFDLALPEPGVFGAVSVGSFGAKRMVVGARVPDEERSFIVGEIANTDGFGPRRAAQHYSTIGQLVQKLSSTVTLRAFAGSYMAEFESPGTVRGDDLSAGRANFFTARFDRQGGQTARHQGLIGLDVAGLGGRTQLEVGGTYTSDRLRNNFTGYLADARGDGRDQLNQAGTLLVRAEHHRHFTLLGAPLSLDLSVGGRGDRGRQLQQRYAEFDGAAFATEVDATFFQGDAWGWAEAVWAPGAWQVLLGARVDVLGFRVDDALAVRGDGDRRTSVGVHPGLKIGLSRGLGEHVRVFANYGDGFRSPQANSLGEGERAPFVTVRSAELGAGFSSSLFSAQLSAFGSSVDDDVFFDPAAGTTVFSGPSLRGGGSAAVTARPVGELLISANATLAAARLERTQSLLPYFAPFVARLDVSDGFQLTDALHLRAGVGVTVIAPRPLPYDEWSYATTLADALVALRHGPVELRAEVHNLFDSRWRDGEYVYASSYGPGSSASRLPARHFTAGIPRQFAFVVEVHL